MSTIKIIRKPWKLSSQRWTSVNLPKPTWTREELTLVKTLFASLHGARWVNLSWNLTDILSQAQKKCLLREMREKTFKKIDMTFKANLNIRWWGSLRRRWLSESNNSSVLSMQRSERCSEGSTMWKEVQPMWTTGNPRASIWSKNWTKTGKGTYTNSKNTSKIWRLSRRG